MAQTAAVKRAPAPTEQPRNKGGRPPGARNKPKDGIAKTWDYTQFQSRTFRKPLDFYSYLAGYPDKTGLQANIYRLQPRLDLSLIGISETNIYKTISEAEMTEDWIAGYFGRGEYMLTLNDGNRPRGQTEVCKTWFDCRLAEKPPQYDPRSLLLADAKNVDEINRQIAAGVFVREQGTGAVRLRAASDGPPPNGQGNTVVVAAPQSPLVGTMENVFTKMIERSMTDPHDQFKNVIETAKLLHPPQTESMETVVERVLSRHGINGNNAAQAAAAPADEFTIFDRMSKRLAQYGVGVAAPAAAGGAESNGNGSAGANIMANAAGWMPHVAPAIAQARGLITDVISLLRVSRPAAPLQQPNGVVPMQQTQQPPQMPMPRTVDEAIPIVADMALQQMQQGMSGHDFAAWLCGFFVPPLGVQVYETLEQAGGTAAVMGALAMNPATRGLANDPAQRSQIESFLDSFFTFDAGGLNGSRVASEVSPAAAPPSA